MRATVKRIGGHLVAETPGLSRMSVQFDAAAALLTIVCPVCRQRTEQVLSEGDTFEVNHRRNCGLERAIRRLIEQHPELVGKGTVVIVFHGGSRSPSA